MKSWAMPRLMERKFHALSFQGFQLTLMHRYLLSEEIVTLHHADDAEPTMTEDQCYAMSSDAVNILIRDIFLERLSKFIRTMCVNV